VEQATIEGTQAELVGDVRLSWYPSRRAPRAGGKASVPGYLAPVGLPARLPFDLPLLGLKACSPLRAFATATALPQQRHRPAAFAAQLHTCTLRCVSGEVPSAEMGEQDPAWAGGRGDEAPKPIGWTRAAAIGRRGARCVLLCGPWRAAKWVRDRWTARSTGNRGPGGHASGGIPIGLANAWRRPMSCRRHGSGDVPAYARRRAGIWTTGRLGRTGPAARVTRVGASCGG